MDDKELFKKIIHAQKILDFSTSADHELAFFGGKLYRKVNGTYVEQKDDEDSFKYWFFKTPGGFFLCCIGFTLLLIYIGIKVFGM